MLAVVLLLLLVGINCLVNRCGHNIGLISDYFMPRFPLLIAAYTLVQALPVSFFFFAQLNNTRFSSPLQPNGSYMSFNIAMAFLSCFLTLAIPLFLALYLYYIYHKRTNSVTAAKDLRNIMTNEYRDHASMSDPLWSGYTDDIRSYLFAVAVFILPFTFGLFLSVFIFQLPWQLAGLICALVLFIAFTAFSDHFESTISKIFWVLFPLLLVGFLFLLSGMSSSLVSAPCGHENLGFLGIGLLYGALIAAGLYSGYLMYNTSLGLYNNHIKPHGFFVSQEEAKTAIPL